jgi:FtsZ-binding cell division protein ZapB
MQAQLPVDLRSFEALETKIQKTVELVSRLRDENASLRSQVDALQNAAADSSLRAKELDGMRLTSQQLERELLQLKDERQHVLSKVDGLLASFDNLEL